MLKDWNTQKTETIFKLESLKPNNLRNKKTESWNTGRLGHFKAAAHEN